MPTLQDTIDRLAGFEPTGLPVVSLYLDLRPDERGRDRFDQFVRKELPARARTYVAHSAERESLEQDVERIRAYLDAEVRPSANGLAVFACSGAGLFEAVQLDAPLDQHRLYLYDTPHLYHLARVQDQFPRYAAVLVDSASARIIVFELGEPVTSETVESDVKPKQHKKGGWSQARYQRHTENVVLQHAKEVVDALDRIVRDDDVGRIVLAGEESVLPTFREQLPQHLAERIVDVVPLDVRTPEQEVLAATLEAVRRQDAKQDEDKVQRAVDGYRSGGLGVVGVEATLEALTRGQVDELLISTVFELRRPEAAEVDAEVLEGALAAAAGEGVGNGGGAAERAGEVDLADELVTRARTTGAAVTFIEDASLLDEVGGVAALLRFSL
jgi:peptide subunit release factor 1 (eRF1)